MRTLKKRGTTQVSLAEHIRLNRLCVIKTIRGNFGEGEAVLREAESLRQLVHPAIPKIYDIEEEKDGFSIVEEYIQGESLTSYCLSKNPRKQEIIDLMIQLSDLLIYLHGRTPPMLHLDLKPDNLLVNEGKLYLIDFGSALHKEVGGGETLTGTPGYAAPECYRGQADARSDIYSAGKLLSYMISKSRDRELRKGQLKYLNAVAERACREKPADRYRSASAMKKALFLLKRREGKEKESFVIGLAGSGRRMGVTHFALACAAYAKKRGERVLYLECNENALTEQIAEKAKRQEGDGIILYHKIHLAECPIVLSPGKSNYFIGREKEYYKACGYSVILADFGVLTTENLQEFTRSDLCLFFAGEKDWELENTWRGLRWLSGFEEKLLVLLFGSSIKRFRIFSKRLSGISCRRVPFINGMESASEREKMRGLLAEVMESM